MEDVKRLQLGNSAIYPNIEEIIDLAKFGKTMEKRGREQESIFNINFGFRKKNYYSARSLDMLVQEIFHG